MERVVDFCLEKSDMTTENYSKCLERIKIMINRPINKTLDQKKNTLETKLNKVSGIKLIQNKYSNEMSSIKSEYYLNDLKNVNELNSLSVDEDVNFKETKQVKNKLRRSLPLPNQKRFLGYSTTTSATGLPIDLPPSRQRSISVVCCSNNCKFKKIFIYFILNNLIR